jgi:predicted nucleic acid-binding protein
VIVLDASAVLDGLLDARSQPDIARVLSRSAEPLAAPDLLDLEIAGVLRRWEARGQIATRRAREALEDLAALPIVRYPARALLDEVWKLRHNLTVYDAVYVALAQALAARLLTTDGRMASAAGATGVEVIRLAEQT